MNRAVCAFKMEAERKGKEGAVAKKRAREALEYFVKLYEKARSDVDKLREKPPLSSPAVIKSRNRNRVLPRMAI